MRIFVGKKFRGQSAHRRSTNRRNGARMGKSEQPAVFRFVQRDEALVRFHVLGAILRKNGNEFRTDDAVEIGRHRRHCAAPIWLPCNNPLRLHELAAAHCGKSLLHCSDTVAYRKQLPNKAIAKHQHAHTCAFFLALEFPFSDFAYVVPTRFTGRAYAASMRYITVIDGHPDPSEARLNHALADRYTHAARAAGSEVRRITISNLHVPVLRAVSDFFQEEAPESLRDAQRDIAWADHLVFFYPLWHGTMPALLKAFIEQTFRPGFAMDYGGKNRFPKPLFKGKSARVVVTMGMPAFIYRSVFGAYGVKGFERSALALCGIKPIDETLIGGAGGECAARSAKWLDLMDKFAEQDASPELRRRRRFVRRLARNAVLLAVSYAAYVIATSTSRGWMQPTHIQGNGDARPDSSAARPREAQTL